MLKQNPELHALFKGVTCFLFDLDGTLIDSSPCHERAFFQTLEADLPQLVSSFVYEEHKGKSTKETFEALGIAPGEQLTALTLKKQETYRKMVDDGEVVAFPYARELLLSLRDCGHKAWVVTGASRRSAEASLVRLEFIQFFEGLTAGDETARTKPAPDLYLKCIADHGLDTRQALAIEDALPGIQSARAAGLNVVAVNNPELSRLPEYVGTLKDLHEICRIART